MNTNITQTIYDSLKTSTEEIGKIVAERDALDAKIKSGRYTQAVVQNELFPKWGELRHKVDEAGAAAIKEAQALIDQHQVEIERMNDLNPKELTPDLQLLQAGVPLLARDIEAILRRSEGNRTMTQLALRFAKANNIDVGRGHYDAETVAAQETVRRLREAVHYYAKYIGRSSAKEMLDKFFGVEG